MRRWVGLLSATAATAAWAGPPIVPPSVIGAGPNTGMNIGNGPASVGFGTGGNRPPGGHHHHHGGTVVYVPGVWWGGYGYGYGPYSPYGNGYNDSLAQQNYLLQQQNIELQRQRLQADQDKLDAANRERLEQQRAKNNREKARTAQRAGVRHFGQGNYKLASERFKDAAVFDAESPQPQLLLGQAYFAQKRYSDAARAIRNGLRLNPNTAALGEVNVRGLYLKPDVLEAQLASLAAALQANPLDRDGMFLFGYMLFQTGEPGSAKTIFEQVAKLDAADSSVAPFIQHFAAKREPPPGEPVPPADPSAAKKP